MFLKEIGTIKIINEQRKVCGSQSEANCVEIAKGDTETIKVKMNAEGLFPLGHRILGDNAPCLEMSTNERKD